MKKKDKVLQEKVAECMQINILTNKPRWTISEHLTEAIREIEEYEWMEVRGEDGNTSRSQEKKDKVLQEFDEKFGKSIRYPDGSHNKEYKIEIKELISQVLDDQKQQWKEWALGCLPETLKFENGSTEVENCRMGWNACIEEIKKRIEEL